MAIQIGSNYMLKNKTFLDARQSFDNITAMTSFSAKSLPDGFIAYVKSEDKYYKFNSTNDFDTQLGYWREYNGGGGGSSTDEKVKLNNTSESKYLEELIDNSTIEVDVDNGVIKAVSLDGLETTVATLNFVKNLDKDIMTYLSSIGNPMAFKGVVADDDALGAITDMVSGDTYIVQSSASNSDKTMTFIYNGVEFVPMAETSIEVRDFTVDPIDLSTETTGTLHKSKIDQAIARLADVLSKSMYAGSADGIVKQADKLTGLTSTISALNDAVTNSHKHANKAVLDKIISNGIGEGFLSDMGTYISFLHIGTTSPNYDSQLWVDNTDSSAPILKIYDGIDWVTVSAPSTGTAIIIDTTMSDTSTNAVQNNVIKKYVDSKAVEVSSTSGNAIETKTDGIYVKKTSVSTDSDNALSEKSNGLYVKDLSSELDKINYAQKTVNKELDYCYITDSSYGITATCAANDNLIKLLDTRDTNMEIDSDSYIKLCANKRYSISCDFLTKSAVSVYIQDKEGNQYANRGYISGGTYSGSSPSLIIEPKTDIYIGFVPVASFVIYSDCSYISIHEIGRAVTIDPLEYVNESEGIEDTPIGHIMACMSNSAPKHYLICDGTEYNITDYPYLAEHFKTEFGKVNYFGGDGTTTFAVPNNMDGITSVLYCIKCEPTYFMKNSYGGFQVVDLWDGSYIAPCQTTTTYINETLTLNDSILNYDEIEIYGQWYRTSDNQTGSISNYRTLVRNFVDENDKVNGGTFDMYITMTLHVSFAVTGDKAIEICFGNKSEVFATTGDAVKIFKIVGYKGSNGSANGGSCDCITYTDDEVATEIDTVLEG